MNDILNIVKSPASPEKFRKINAFVQNVNEKEAEWIFKQEVVWELAPGLLLSVAVKLENPLLLSEIVQNSKICKTVRRRAAKSPVLYREGSRLIDSGYLLKFLGQVSYSTRDRIINNLGIHVGDEAVGDKIFGSVKNDYGLSAAAPILPACSQKLISKHVNSGGVKLRDRSVLEILKKHPACGIEYFKSECGRGRFHLSHHNSSLKYLLHNYGSEYLKILDSHTNKGRANLEWDWKLGGNTTRTLLKSNISKAEKIVSRYHSVIRMDQARRILSWDQYKSTAEDVIRKHLDYLDEGCDLTEALKTPLKDFLRRVPLLKQRELIRHCCQTVLGLEVSQAGAYLSEDLIFLLGPEDRRTIADHKIEAKHGHWHYLSDISYDDIPAYSQDSEEYFWTAMKPIDDSVPKLTKLLLKEQSAENRATLTSALVLACTVNRDSDQLLEVLKLLTKRSRNDQNVVREKLLGALEFAVNYVKFKDEHWNGVMELLRIQKLYKESTVSYPPLYRGFIAFSYEHNRPVNELIKLIISISERAYGFSHEFLSKPPRTCKPLTPDQQKSLFLVCLKEIEEAYGKEDDLENETEDDDKHGTIKQLVLNLFEQISEWNHTHGEKYGKIVLTEYPWIIKTIVSECKKTTTLNKLKDLVELGREDEIYKCLESDSLPEEMLLFALKRKPVRLLDYSENIILQIMTPPCRIGRFGQEEKHKYHRFLQSLKRSHFQSFIEKLKTECVKVLDQTGDEEDEEKLANAFKVLLLLDPSPETLKQVEKYVPEDPKIDPENLDQCHYTVRAAIAGYLQFVPEAELVLPLVKTFCVGDYLKLTVVSLYTTILNSPGSTAGLFLKAELFDRPVSYRKHILRLYFKTTPLHDHAKILSEMWRNEKNLTIQIEVFRQAHELFLVSPSVETLKVLGSFVDSLTTDDSDCLNNIVNNLRDLSPTEFFTETFSLYFDALKRTEAPDKLQIPFMEQVRKGLDTLSDDFVPNFIHAKLQQLRVMEVRELDGIIGDYIRHGNIVERFERIQGSLRHLVEHQWDDTETEYLYGGQQIIKYPAREFLWTFVSRLDAKDLEDVEHRRKVQDVFTQVAHMLETLADEGKTFRYALCIQLMLVFLQIYNPEDKHATGLKFGQNAAPILDGSVKKFGGEIVTILALILKEFIFGNFKGVSRPEQTCEVISGILKGSVQKSGRRDHLILAVNLLPPDSSHSSSRFQQLRHAIVQEIQSSADVTVNIFYELKTSPFPTS